MLRPLLKAADVPALVALSQAKPGGLSYASFGIASFGIASFGIGSSAHLCAEMSAAANGAKLVHVHYNGSGPVVAGLLVGDTNFMFEVLARPRVNDNIVVICNLKLTLFRVVRPYFFEYTREV